MNRMPQLKPTSIVIGFDVHKYSHVGVAQNIMGQELGKIEFTNQTINECLDWINTFG